MKKFLALLYLVIATFFLGVQQVSAQSVKLNAPSDVCKGSFATMNIHLTSGTAVTNPTTVWTITKKKAGTTVTSLYGTFNGQTAASSNTDNSTVSVQFNTVDTITFTAKVPYKSGKTTIDTLTATKTIIVHDCSIDVCYGSDNSGTGFTETFGNYTDGIRHQVQAPATISYTFQSGPDGSTTTNVEDNYYCVATSTQQHDGWIKAPDHTSGDYKGAMLVCNSQNQGLAFYTRTITGLCPGAKYNFTAYFMNLNTQAILENTCAGGYMYAGVDFQIIDASTNALLATFPTYDVSMGIPNSTWNLYGGTFKTPPGVTSVKFQMVNRNPGGCGNDIAVDDITFSYCGPKMFTYIDGLKGNTSNSICQNQSVSLTGSVTPVSYFTQPTYYWQDSIAGQPGWNNITIDGSQFIKTNDSTLTVSGDVLQSNGNNSLQYFFRVKVVENGQDPNGTCARFSDPATLTVLPVPMITLDNPEICIGDSVHLVTQKVYSHYKWVINSTPVRYIEGDTSAGVFNAIADKPPVSTTYSVIGTVTFGKGKSCSRQATANVIVDTLPVGNLMPAVANICINTPVTLQANPSNAAYTIRWSTSPADVGTSITVQKSAVGSYSYSDTLFNGVCKISQTAVVNVRPMPTPSVTKDTLKQCNNGTFTLNGSTPATGQMGTWSLLAPTNGAAIAAADLHNPSASVTGLTLGSKVTAVWDIQDTVSTTSCDSSAKVVLWNRPMPTTGVINQTTLTNCAGIFNLTANSGVAGETGTWTIVSNTSGGATGVSIGSPNAASTTVTLSGTRPQTVVLAWTLNNGTCDGAADQVTLNYVAPPTISIDSVTDACASNGSFNLVINGFTGNPTKISLTGTVPGFTAWNKKVVDFTQPLKITLPVSIPTTTAAGTYKFTLTVLNDSTACSGTPITFTVPVKIASVAPTAASASPASICVSGNTTLSVTGGFLGTGAQWKWYAGTCGGTAIGTGATLTVPVTATTTYYVRAEDPAGTCSATACTNTTVTVYASATTAKAGPDQEHCSDPNFKMAADTVITGTGVWTIVSGTPVIDKPNSPTSWVSVPPGTAATLLWTVTNGPCSGGSDQVVLTNRASIANDVISANQKICLGSNANPIVSVGTLSGGSGTYTYQWQSAPKASGPFTNIAGATSAAYNPGAPTDSVFFRRIVTSGACMDTSNTIRILVVNKDPYVVSQRPDSVIQCNTALVYTNYFTQPVFADPYNTPLNITFADVTTGSCPQTMTRTWTATDSCGRKVTAKQTLTIQDTTRPVFNGPLPTDITVNCDAIPAQATLTATDACSTPTVVPTSSTVAIPGATCAKNYKLIYTWTATDACGNKAVYNQTITVQDTTRPVFTGVLPKDITVSCDAVPAQATLTASDNCSGAANVTITPSRTIVPIAGACANNYKIINTWTAKDECGNTATYTQTITVQDVTAPTFDMAAPADVVANCDAIPAPATLTASDNCSAKANVKVVQTSSTKAIPGSTCAKNYILTYIWTATDECGNSTVVKQNITVQDTTRPTFTTAVPKDVTVNCNAIPTQADLAVTDNCSATANVTIKKTSTTTSAPGACGGNYVLTYIWTATDECGNSAVVKQNITVQDTTRPTFTTAVPKDITVNCDAVPIQADMSATDNCTAAANVKIVKTSTTTPIAGACAKNYILTYIWTATDDCGNSAVVKQNITVQDTTRPTFTTAVPANITVNCDAIPAQTSMSATDNCSAAANVTVTTSQTHVAIPGACANNYKLLYTWTAKDECGNTAVVTQTITVQDTTRPTFTTPVPKDITVNCDAVPAQGSMSATDNCSAAANVTITPSQTRVAIPGACANNYKLIYTWTAKDECGNTAVVNQTVTVQDTTRPTFTTPIPANVTVNCDAVPAQIDLSATDNCSAAANVTVTKSVSAKTIGSCANNYAITYTWTAKDECGNTAIAQQVITVRDTTRPKFTMAIPANATVNCDAVPAQADLTVSDNCSPTANITVKKTSVRTNGACANSYTLVYTWTATDECGNVATASQTLTVQDTTRPYFTMAIPKDVTVNCDAIPAQAVLTAADNCSAGSKVTVTPTVSAKTPGGCGNNYTITYTWTAKDECGNTTVAKQVITVQDTTRPKFDMAVPADVTVNCDAIPTQATMTASDNCSAKANVTVTPTQAIVPIAGACANNYKIIYTWTAKDECGNTAVVSQTVTVRDTTRPTFDLPTPKDITVNCDAIPAQATMTASDNCSAKANVTVTPSQATVPIAGACANNYKLIYTWTAKDECGNTAVVSQTITVQDTTRPTFDLPTPKDITVNCDAIPAQATLTASDNCSAKAKVTVTPSQVTQAIAGACVNNYRIIYTWTAKDECGNTAVVSQTITVQDTTRPTFTTPAPKDITVNCDAIPTQADLTASDNCSAAAKVKIVKSSTTTPIAGACAKNYVLTYIWTATDECGNSAVVKQNITVQDTTRPTFSMPIPKDVTVNCDAIPAQATLTATDNCSAPAAITITKSVSAKTPGNCANNYTITYTWTAKDECGNTAVAKQVITVQDTTRPTFDLPTPKDITVNCDAIPAQATMTASDNCSAKANVTVTPSQATVPIAGACANNYKLIYTWTAKDECGNTAVVSQTITVQDTTRPTFDMPTPKDITVNCDAIPAQATLTASDNCSAKAKVTVTPGKTTQAIAGACANNYKIIYTWTAKDECGNTAVVSQTITVQDTTRPTFTVPVPKDTVVNCDAIPAQATLTASDNCSATAKVTIAKSSTTTPIAGSCAKNYILTYTWTAKDECGNTAVVSQRITVQDTTRPKFTVPTPKDTTVNCDAIPAQADLAVTDNCSVTNSVKVVKSSARTNIVGACGNHYLLTYTWTATDECGNVATVKQVITVQDTTRPKFTMPTPKDTTVNCDAVPAQSDLTVSDNCSATANVKVAKTVTRVNGTGCANNYKLIYTWTATDECFNVATVSQTITVQDTTRPKFTMAVPKDTIVNCDAIPAQTNLTASDNCSAAANVKVVKTVSRVNIPGATCTNSYKLVYTWTASDECGNKTVVTQNVTVQDTTRPKFTMPVPKDTIVNCDAVPVQSDLTASDNCSATANVIINKSVVRTAIPGACVNNYKLTYTWTATDECGNKAVVSQVVTVQDTTRPKFAMPIPLDTTVNCDAIPAQQNLNASDNCSPVNKVTIVKSAVASAIPGACGNNYKITYTWVATDECGNKATVVQVITVQDTTRPKFTTPVPKDTTVNCDAIPAQISMSAMDNCSTPANVKVTQSSTTTAIPGGCAKNYILTYSWTATDECGNAAVVKQNITVQDTTRPKFTMTTPKDTTVNCNAIPAQTDLTAADNCSGASGVKVAKSVTRVNIPGACANNYKLVYTWTASDECGNKAVVSQTITVQDTTRPTFTMAIPRDTTVNCDAVIPQATLTVLDNCSATANVAVVKTVTRVNTPGACANNYKLVYVWTATDECGNKAVATQTVTVQDTTRPKFDQPTPANITVDCDKVPVQGNLTATDNCSATANVNVVKTVTTTPIPGACANNYTLTYTWTATDECGNKSVVSQVITVVDRTKPVFSTKQPNDTTVSCDAIPTQPNLVATDNCSSAAKLVYTKGEKRVELASGACANSFQLIRTWNVKDECGNDTTVQQTITVVDNTKPTFTTSAPADVTVNCDAVPTQPDLQATDNCSPAASITITKHEIRQDGNCKNSYILVRTWTATDQCGNATTLAQTITVQDTTRPRFTPAVPADITVSCDAVPTQVTLAATDNCSAPANLQVVKTSQRVDIPGACANNYKLLYTWTVTDECGNTATATQTITVVDNKKPVFTKPAPADVTVLCDQVPAQIDLTYADNCSATDKIRYTKQVVKTSTPGACVNTYTLRYTWIITDECGNVDSTHQIINVIDTVPPVFTVTAPQDITVSCDKVPAQPTLYAKDGCDPNPITAVADERREDIPGACANNYRLIRTWTVYDACGNKATLTQIITVVDNTKPTFPNGKPADVTVECNAIPVQQPIAVADNCSATSKITETMYVWKELIAGACVNNYKLHYTWVAKDECGNVDSTSQIVTVRNTQKPTFDQVMPRDTTVNCDATLPWPTITATSACGALGNVKVVTSTSTRSVTGCKKAYTETRTWTATDECGNTATWKQVVNVQDTTRPVFTMKIPRDTTVGCDSIPAAPQLSGSDNCSGGTDLSGSYKVRTVAGNCPQSYQLIRTWTLKDACGNTNTAVQTITVRDITAPVIAPAPADITIYCQDPIPAHVTLKATDNCDATFPKNATYSEDPYVKDICNGYTITRRWSAVDACGNVAQQVIQHVIIKPCTKPALADSLPITCSSNPYITLSTKGTVNKPTYTLTAVEPAGVVNVPVSQTYNVFNLKGATSATFIVTDGLTGCVSDPKVYTLKYNTSPVVNLGRDTSICGGNSLVLDAGAANFNYNIVWSTGEKTQRINITKAGTYWVRVTNANCVVTDTIKVGLIPTPLVDIPDTTICRGQTVKLDAYVSGAAYLWSNGTTSSSIITGAQDQYWVKVSKNGCITIDTVNVTVNPPPDIQLKQDTAICPGQSVMLTVSADGGRIRWVNGSTQPSIVVTKPGGYWVTVTKDNCVVRDTVNVREQPKLKLDLGADQELCPGSQITLDATNADAISYLWNDGDPDPVKTVTTAGLYKVAVMDRFCQMVYFDSVDVSMSSIPTVSLGNDTVMCNGETLVLTPKGSNIKSVLWSDGSTGSTLKVTKPGTYTVTAFNECGSSTDQVTVTFQDCVPNPTFPNAFSPNGDGKNDIFLPTVRGPMYNYELRIFNRWGQLIFLSTDAKKGWDGTFNGEPVEIGTYVYWVTYKVTPTGPANIIKGSVVLIR
ncbi:hypothetical protein DCC81_22700 [Chitinophaga parva]|uniref:HYR-like domain-containing protein n=1 Tax=Chitinophaga parva TaxID=2169414 RepID=A0A2T7BDN2_9BACT|nr:gliding motility-associated C-terminal domain-containing protein [Chitinophaga parva]PUZ23208.1 hypothetical protein DCC81_22700 [Chitinophaga parva]